MPVFLMELEINTAFCLPPNLCTTIITAVSTALGIGLVYCFCITSRRSIGAENRFGLEFFLYLFFSFYRLYINDLSDNVAHFINIS